MSKIWFGRQWVDGDRDCIAFGYDHSPLFHHGLHRRFSLGLRVFSLSQKIVVEPSSTTILFS